MGNILEAKHTASFTVLCLMIVVEVVHPLGLQRILYHKHICPLLSFKKKKNKKKEKTVLVKCMVGLDGISVLVYIESEVMSAAYITVVGIIKKWKVSFQSFHHFF